MGIFPDAGETNGYIKAQRDMLLNAVSCDVPNKYIREMITGRKELEPGTEEDHPAAEDLDISEDLATMALKTLQQYIHNIHGECGKCICAKEDDGRCWMGGCEEVETSASNLDTKNDRIGQKGENK